MMLTEHITIRKFYKIICQVLLFPLRRISDRFKTSYNTRPHDRFDGLNTGFLYRLTSMTGPDVCEKLKAAAVNHFRHRFLILGREWKEAYCVVPEAIVEKRIESSGPEYVADGQGIRNGLILNRANLKYAQKIGQCLDPNYQPIPWHLDVHSGYHWHPGTWYRDIGYGDLPGVDVKVPWELSRMQHLSQLALTHGFPGGRDESPSLDACRRAFRNQVLDFISRNPPRFGVNWACTMDVAIRIANWLAAYDIFDSRGVVWDHEFEGTLLNSIQDHGHHIATNLEWSHGLTTNHYLANLAGLLFTAVYLPGTRNTERWKRFCMAQLKKEIHRQIYEDGTDFEASTCYHRLALEIFFFATLIAVKDDETFDGANYRDTCQHIFGRSYCEKLYKMFDALCHLLKPDGRMPQIGDNDSGRFLVLFPRDVLDMRYLLSFGAVFFYESKWKINEFFGGPEDLAEVEILFGKNGLQLWESLPPVSLVNVGDRSFPDSGWHVLRRNRNYCIFSCGPNGQNGKGGHAHNDKLAFELQVKGRDVIVDPGTFSYTARPHERNRFRSTAVHSTLVAGGMEQSPIDSSVDGLFRLADRASARITAIGPNSVTGEHIGYGPPTRRELTLGKGFLAGIDHCPLNGEKSILFHLAPGLEVMFGQHRLPEIDMGGWCIRFESDCGSWSARSGDYSGEYGRIQPSTILCLTDTAVKISWRVDWGAIPASGKGNWS